jgi:hypothetical protein
MFHMSLLESVFLISSATAEVWPVNISTQGEEASTKSRASVMFERKTKVFSAQRKAPATRT